MLDAGLCVTLNSDDPAYFGGYVLANYFEAAAGLSLGVDHLRQLARNSIEASWLEGSAKAGLIARIDAVPAPS
jgi:adenosine deaminase